VGVDRRRSAPSGRLAGGGTPIEEAPLWVLAIFAFLLWLMTFPAVVGLLAVWGRWHGAKLPAALAALGIAVFLVVGLATRKPWRRPTATDPGETPFFARFTTWLVGALLLPNIIFGVLVLTHEERQLGYQESLVIGAIISAVQGTFALIDRWKRRRRGLSETDT
jgi:hypothetical protein